MFVRLDYDVEPMTSAELYRIGLIVLQSDASLELEFPRALRDGPVVCHYVRIPSSSDVTVENLARMELDLPRTASLLPSYLDLSAIGYACTSGALTIGSARVRQLIGDFHDGIPVTNPLDAALGAFEVLGLKRVGLLSPYIEEVSLSMRQFFADHGVDIVSFGSFEQSSESEVACISESSTLAGIERLGSESLCDGIFISCTNLRSFSILERAEEMICKPVISSNQALLWDLLRLSGCDFRPQGFGSLLRS